jgi:hypothetical protein
VFCIGIRVPAEIEHAPSLENEKCFAKSAKSRPKLRAASCFWILLREIQRDRCARRTR